MLHITGRREDGYHELQTVFQFLDVGDTLQFECRDDANIHLSGSPYLVRMEDDLVFRAAQCLQEEGLQQAGLQKEDLQQDAQCQLGANIRLQKNMPLGAGLGGGSSDAATCLLALNKLWKLNLGTEKLCELGLGLGADVPVFVRGIAAFAEGVGEKLTPIALPEPWFLVLIPPVHVSTKEIFCNGQLTRDCSAIKLCDLSRQQWHNVCTPVVVESYPEVAQAIEILNNFSIGRMSGTGASVFAEFENKALADGAISEIRKNLPENWESFVAKGLNESPLHTFMKSL